MKILFDSDIFNWQSYGGISRLFAHHIYQLRIQGHTPVLSLLHTHNQYYHELFPNTSHQFLSDFHFKGKWHLFRLIHQLNTIYTKYHLYKNDFDVFHPTFYTHYNLTNIKKPSVITIHDMVWEEYPHIRSHMIPSQKHKQRLAEAATHVIAVSETTKQGIAKHYSIPSEKITVIHLGGFHNWNIDLLKKQKWLIYIGNRSAYKNFCLLLSICKRLFYHLPEWKLYCLGGGELTHSEKNYMQEQGLNNHIFQVEVDELQLHDFYQKASVYISTSKLEGFGIPIIESLSAGCRLALTDIPIYREVAQDNAIYYNPDDADDMLNKIIALCTTTCTPKEILDRIQYASNFTWEKMTNKIIEVYKQII